MEAVILKYICANQGAVNLEDLVSNLGESANEVVSNPSRFALSSGADGQQRVVARSGLRLCRKKDCPGDCRSLHLCKNFLFSGTCHFLLRRGCSFSHELNSDYNQRLLKEHELDCLNRAELCTLLLQSDNTMLPSICHDYNNGDGLFGRCERGLACERLHVCERMLDQSCSCYREHNFFGLQPRKSLNAKMVPNDIIVSLKSVYPNKKALWISGRGGASRGHRGNCGGPNERHGRGRARGGNRGGRGTRGHRGNLSQRRTPSHSDISADLDLLDLYTEDGVNEHGGCNSSSSDVSAAGYDVDRRSDSGLNGPGPYGRGRGGYRGPRGARGNRGGRGTGYNPLQQLRSTSFGDLWGESSGLNLYGEGEPSRSDSRQEDPDSSNSDVSAITDDAGAQSAKTKRRSKSRNRTSASKGRGSNHGGPRRASATDDPGAGAEQGNKEQKKGQKNKTAKIDKTEICMYFIKGYCKNGDKCFKAHDKMPYRWQVHEGDQWKALPSNEAIEKEFCDPGNSYSSGSPPVHFDTMTRGESKVRRLTTVNSMVEPSFIHTTEWLWYWQDEFGKWNQYGSDSAGRKSADINSATLEKKFLEDQNDTLEFSVGSQSYSLSFQDMIQTNKHYGTKRLVSRRPRFVSTEEVKSKKVTRPPAVPDNWDKTQIPERGFSKVSIPQTSDEFKRLQTLFSTTMRGFDIIKIERIQNKALWELFQWQKNKMKTNNGGQEVVEKQLFHGTNPEYVEAICHNNFEWRLCGVNGTAYGKGSYFARDAKYSHSYTGNSDVRTMFVARVLVGSYTKGDSNYKLPPSKDGGVHNLYDSCVNDVTDPSIFVVFKENQIYPEYLLQYKTTHPLVDRLSTPTVSVQQPKPVVPPKPSVSQTSAAAYKPSTMSYNPSTALYHLSTASAQQVKPVVPPTPPVSQSSTASYNPSSASYNPSSPSYNPSSASYLSRSSSTSSPPYRSSYQPASYPSSSSSRPQPSKSDSCVIA
ncbi:protein mono-ADP-ribosyltransferase PARP12 [Cyprinodon tularosa]|uniref:protein mono-ADP-ribosyltransferase PARP12 n=1 Tax=Cyprinodon tularosa TaxID=77115 RepID=UPI0018E24539|nr:protein mono-ADP-ribosyltransferase PARP12 [Cyprinodon tularosa]